ncbi:hypothetical protein [Flavivirga jejuensis]|uniref:Cyclic nucleotide-binding domain-containing protein n=1 Tax=Flavivirga jejuensis TaxID=870487 RepID=A0ABT8WNS2_9FLAO|nr:hypothetical protein [Flavivirga jejuensis]MDO5974796.1 hypothetical protein [Flavivirga jejuensis]
MEDLYSYLNAISPVQETTWNELKIIFTEQSLKKGEYFVKEVKTAKKFGFIRKGIIRAFYRNNEGVEYNKHFFVDNNMIDAYSSLITQ